MKDSNDIEVATKVSEEDSSNTEVLEEDSTEVSEEDSNDARTSLELSEEELNNLDPFERLTGGYDNDDDDRRFCVDDPGFETMRLKMHWCMLEIEEDYREAIHKEYLTFRDIPWGKLSDASQRRYNCFDLALRVFPPRINTYFNNDGRIIFFVLLDKFKLYEVYKFFTSLKEEVYASLTCFIDEVYEFFRDFIEEIRRFFTYR